MTTAMSAMKRFLIELGARQTFPRDQMLFVLDGFSPEFYIVFDLSPDLEQPNEIGTVDLYVAKPGSHPADTKDRMRIGINLRRHGVMRFLFAMGVSQFSEQTQNTLYSMNNVIRTQ